MQRLFNRGVLHTTEPQLSYTAVLEPCVLCNCTQLGLGFYSFHSVNQNSHTFSMGYAYKVNVRLHESCGILELRGMQDSSLKKS
jgi:hypothetical protein